MPGSDVPGEFELIAEYFAPLAAPGALGLTDDAALLSIPDGHDLVLTKDMLVAGRHFFVDDEPASIACKALGVNMSDLAAKGAMPLGFLLGFGKTAQQTREWCAQFAKGLALASKAWACPLLGGDTVNAPVLTLSITAFGAVPAGSMVLRQGSEAGDVLFVSGTIGDAALGLQMRLSPEADWVQALSSEHRRHLVQRYLHPQPRLALGTALRLFASGAMDVSDGLVGDADKLASRLGARCIVDAVPLSPAAQAAIAAAPSLGDVALTGGDDYEILCSVPPARAQAFKRAARDAGIAVSRIGILTEAGDKKTWLNGVGEERVFTRRSYTHNL
ncbi:ThiL Thiamine monophosphate kinase [Rhabdaerophilaceae bacterium]